MKDFIINAAGIGGGQLILLLATPWLSRLYSPSEFGMYATLLAFSGIIATIATLRFDAAIPAVPENDVDPLFHIALALAFLVSFIVAPVAGLIISNIHTFQNPIGVPLHWVAGVAALLGATNACQAWFIRDGRFKWVAALKMLQPAFFAAAASMAILGLNGALVASWLVALLLALWGCRQALRSFDARRSWAAATKARKFPLLSAPMALLDTASLTLPLFFIVASFGNESGGNYSQIQRLIAAPLILLGIAAAQVFYKRAGDLHRSGGAVEPLMWRIVLTLLGLAVLLVIAVTFIGEPAMNLLLGEGWRTDVKFLLLATAPVIFRMVVSPVSSVFMITNRLGLGSAWQASYFAVTVGVILMAYQRLTLEAYLHVLVGAEFGMYLLYLTLAIVAVRKDAAASIVQVREI